MDIRDKVGNLVFDTILSYENSYNPTFYTLTLRTLFCFVSHIYYSSGLPWKAFRLSARTSWLGLHHDGSELWKYLKLVYRGPSVGGHSFVSGGYVLAKEGIGRVCNVPEGMGKVFSIRPRQGVFENMD